MEYDTLPNLPWTNEYILTLKSPEKVTTGVLNSVYDTKLEYQPLTAEKYRFWKFIYQVEYDPLPNLPWTNEYILTLETPKKVALGVLIQFLIPNQTINLLRQKNFDFQNSSIRWSMTVCRTEHEQMSIFWHWNHLRRWLFVFWIQFLIPNQNINLLRVNNVDFQNLSIRWSMTPCRTDHEKMSIFWH